MRLSFIKKLIKMVEDSDIGEIELSRFGTRVRITKNNSTGITGIKKPTSGVEKQESEVKIPQKTEKEEEENVKDKDLIAIKSPMVGTFYRAPAPDAPPYVEKGDRIKKGEIICIVEAMKIMNEIEADVNGEIVDVLVKNEEPVEYNQDLFMVRKT